MSIEYALKYLPPLVDDNRNLNIIIMYCKKYKKKKEKIVKIFNNTYPDNIARSTCYKTKSLLSHACRMILIIMPNTRCHVEFVF